MEGGLIPGGKNCKRNHVHLVEDGRPREKCDLRIVVDIRRLMDDGVVVYRSKTGVIMLYFVCVLIGFVYVVCLPVVCCMFYICIL